MLLGSAAWATSPDHADSTLPHNTRLVVVKHQKALHLFDGDKWIKSYKVALGCTHSQPMSSEPNPEATSGEIRRELGSSLSTLSGLRPSGHTPEGRFYICTRNPASRYHRFLGLSYPDENAVREGLTNGLISRGQAEAILKALAERRRPDWTTPLGGGIGLHGGGNDHDWTAGCIALTDAAIEELDAIVRMGDPVEILP